MCTILKFASLSRSVVHSLPQTLVKVWYLTPLYTIRPFYDLNTSQQLLLTLGFNNCTLFNWTPNLWGHTPWLITLLQLEYGEAVWTKVLKRANCPVPVFCTHQVYPDNLMKDIASACAVIINNNSDVEYFMRFFGRCFVRFFSNFG